LFRVNFLQANFFRREQFEILLFVLLVLSELFFDFILELPVQNGVLQNMLVILSVDSEKLVVEELVPFDSLIGVELQQRPDEFLTLKTHFYV
jgi:hypothetical protein